MCSLFLDRELDVKLSTTDTSAMCDYIRAVLANIWPNRFHIVHELTVHSGQHVTANKVCL